jgi:type III secretion system YscI/HrpB-like protein
MTAIAPAVLDNVVQVTERTGVPNVRPPASTDPAASTTERFAAAMERASGVTPPGGPVRVAQAQSTTAVDAGPAATTSVDPQERTRRALQLDAPNATQSKPSGDSILDGLQKLRGVFDAQQARINQVISQPVTNVNTLIAAQMEVVNFSMLVDVTSKLTGKSTQAFDTLLKGQ